METVKLLSFLLLLLLPFVLLIPRDIIRNETATKSDALCVCVMWRFLSSLSDRFTRVSFSMPEHKREEGRKMCQVGQSRPMTPSPSTKSLDVFDANFKKVNLFSRLPVWLPSPGYRIRAAFDGGWLLFFSPLIFISTKKRIPGNLFFLVSQ